MDRISFITNQGRQFKAGGSGGDHYDIKLFNSKTMMSRVIAVAGSYGDQMKSLKAYYLKVPKEVNSKKQTVQQSRHDDTPSDSVEEDKSIRDDYYGEEERKSEGAVASEDSGNLTTGSEAVRNQVPDSVVKPRSQKSVRDNDETTIEERDI